MLATSSTAWRTSAHHLMEDMKVVQDAGGVTLPHSVPVLATSSTA